MGGNLAGPLGSKSGDQQYKVQLAVDYQWHSSGMDTMAKTVNGFIYNVDNSTGCVRLFSSGDSQSMRYGWTQAMCDTVNIFTLLVCKEHSQCLIDCVDSKLCQNYFCFYILFIHIYISVNYYSIVI